MPRIAAAAAAGTVPAAARTEPAAGRWQVFSGWMGGLLEQFDAGDKVAMVSADLDNVKINVLPSRPPPPPPPPKSPFSRPHPPTQPNPPAKAHTHTHPHTP